MSQYEKTRVSKGQLGTCDTVKYKEAQMGLMGTKNTKKNDDVMQSIGSS